MPVSQTNDHNFLFVQIRMIQLRLSQINGNCFDSLPGLFALLNGAQPIILNERERQRRALLSKLCISHHHQHQQHDQYHAKKIYCSL